MHVETQQKSRQVKKSFLLPKIVLTFHEFTNCFSDLKTFANSRPSVSNFKSLSRSLEQFFLTVGQNNFGNKMPLIALFRTYSTFIGMLVLH